MIEPLNLQMLLINVFAGNVYIFIAIASIAIIALAAKFKMNGLALAMIFFLFGALMYPVAEWLLLPMIVIGGLLIWYQIAKIGK